MRFFSLFLLAASLPGQVVYNYYAASGADDGRTTAYVYGPSSCWQYYCDISTFQPADQFTGAEGNTSDTFHQLIIQYSGGFDGWIGTSDDWRLYSRYLIKFNTTAIPASATISSVTLNLYQTEFYTSIGAAPLMEVYSIPCSYFPLGTGSSVWTSSALSSFTQLASFTTSGGNGWRSVSLPASSVNKQSYSCYMVRPTVTLSASYYDQTVYVSYDSSDGTNKPYLAVNHTPIGGRKLIVVSGD